MRVFLIITAQLLTICGSASAEDLSVLSETPDGVAPGKQLEIYLKQQFYEQLDRRREAFESLKSRSACEQWQKERREFFVRQLGGYPQRTPLNAKTVGKLDDEGYRIEKVIFESRPGHHVTANLYLPKSQGPYPGVLIPCGHSHNGKAAGGYQRISILLARNGMAALCYDPIGQGERYQLLDFENEYETFPQVTYRLPVPHPRVRYLCTQEHTAMGIGCILLGTNVAQYRIWDGMRAIDYLQSRDDIQNDKIGCTGNSGGGTLTAYLMALDDRIQAAAPVCYLTTFRKLIDTRGAQDAEQNIFGQIAFGMDEADYVMMRAPRPTLICAATRDKTFNVEGTWELFRESKRFYSRLGYPERVAINEPDAPHGFYHQQREAATQWMCRWLLGKDTVIREFEPTSHSDPMTDQQLRTISEGDWTQEQLYCTPEGQVMLTPGERSVFQLNAELLEVLKPERESRWKAMTANQRRELIRETIGSSLPDATVGESRSVGRLTRDGYTISKVILSPDDSIDLPALAFIPSNPTGQATLYLHGASMQEDAGPGGPIEALVKQGHVVLAAELRGIGETETGHDRRDYGYGKFGRDVQEVFLAYLIGRSYVGMRTDDVVSWTEFLAGFQASGDRKNDVHVVAIGEATVPALHAVALYPDLCSSLKLRNMIRSWEELVRTPDSHDQLVHVVHGALRRYDLPDLIEMLGENVVTVEQPVDTMGNVVAR
jgi:cephalosporin-C deacetylase-like acetyl esterase